ncbi:MAG: cupin domain-containing protein [Candidatus Woesearchaeota archaeon]
MAYTTNIEKETLDNENYRKVLFTGTKIQLVVMSLKLGEDIPMEVHHETDQFLRIEAGKAYVKIGDEEFNLKDDDIVIVPAGQQHYVKNTGNKELKLYSIYTPPEHAEGTIHKTQAEADAAEHEF